MTLVEIAVVVGIIMILVGLSLPNMVEAKMRANEAATVAALRQLHVAQEMHARRFERMGTLDELKAAGVIDPSLGDGARNGYLFEVGVAIQSAQDRRRGIQDPRWAAYAWPQVWGATGAHVYLITWQGEIFRSPVEVFANHNQAYRWVQSNYFRNFDEARLRQSGTWTHLEGGRLISR